jgi:two-component system CheB/CheR fusion protein
VTVTAEYDGAFEALLEFIRRSRALDFTGYKRPSLMRRFRRRMAAVGCESYADYVDYLEVHPGEYEQLYDALLINVTGFFRDPPVWDHLRDEALPAILGAKPEHEPIRVWSAGCASGQEAYTVAMVLAEILGIDAYRRRVKIYGTDVDDEALATARLATYTPKQVDAVAQELRERYFEPDDDGLAFRKDLRRTLIFGRNDLASDAPISRLDLLLCRNTLIYFTAETQAGIVRRLHFALGEHGVLVLGQAEILIAHRELFAPMALERHIFSRLPSGSAPAPAEPRAAPPDEALSARAAALEAAAQAQLIVSRDGALTYANRAARELLRLGPGDLGRSLDEVAAAQRPVDVRAAVGQALTQRRRVALGEVAHRPAHGRERRLDVAVTPLRPAGGAPLGATITYDDVTRSAALRTELETSRRDLELAYEELQATIDELETTNEELQSANEELQTTNEELQSTNEELETMNEELQSANEELETMNDELRDRTGALNEVNGLLEAIHASLGVAVAVLDAHQRVQVWNRHAEGLWGLRADEALGRHFLELDIGLPTERLAPALRAVLGGAEERREQQLDAVNRRGRPIVCSTTVLALVRTGEAAALRGAIVLMEERPPDAVEPEPAARGTSGP